MYYEIPSNLPMAEKLPLLLIGRQRKVYQTALFCPKLLRPFRAWYIARKLRMKHKSVKSILRHIRIISDGYFT
jgi:hypothetical protein